MARLLSDKMASALGQPVIVENRPGGAGGTIGAKFVATAEPDGHTLLMGSTSTLLIAPLIYRNVGYSAETFAPVALVSESVELLAVHPSIPVQSLSELVSVARSQPGTLSYGSAGIGTLPHLEAELLKARAQIEISHVPYRGGGQALTGLLGAQVHLLFSTLTQSPHVHEGRVRGLAVTSETRTPLAPDLPTMVESGFEGFVTSSITAIVAPPGTPMEIRRRVNAAVTAALASAEVEQAFSKLGAEARRTSPEEFEAYLEQARERWGGIIETTRVTVD
jgi:tripartite-type tricarboxylate transporter receptor subunit TctC